MIKGRSPATFNVWPICSDKLVFLTVCYDRHNQNKLLINFLGHAPSNIWLVAWQRATVPTLWNSDIIKSKRFERPHEKSTFSLGGHILLHILDVRSLLIGNNWKKVKNILCIRGPFYSRIHQATGGIIDTFSTSLNGDLIAHNSPTTSSLTSFRFHVTTECLWIAMKSISDKMLRSLRNYFEYRYFGLKWYGKKKTNKMLTVPLHYVCHILTINIRFWERFSFTLS